MALCSKCVQKSSFFGFFFYISFSRHEGFDVDICYGTVQMCFDCEGWILEDLRAGEAFHTGRTCFTHVLAHTRAVQVNTLKEHAQVNSHKHTGEAESLFHWSMTAKPPSGTARSPWQSQRFSGPKDVVNKSGESSPTSGRSQACAKWSVFPVNLRFLNPVKLRTLPKSRPPDLSHNTKFRKHHASVSVCNVRGEKLARAEPEIFFLKHYWKILMAIYNAYSNSLLLCHNMRNKMAV